MAGEATAASGRLTAHEIFEAALDNARDELKRSTRALACSGVAGGLTMGLTPLAVAAVARMLGHEGWGELVAQLFYPVGFITVIIGRQQLFTENTLYPVLVVLDERRNLLNTARLWVVVFLSNIMGALLFGFLAARTGAVPAEVLRELVQLGGRAAQVSFAQAFWTGIIGGWLIALVAWVVSGSQWTIGQIAITWLLTFVVGAGHFAHCIAGSAEILTAVAAGSLGPGVYLQWLVAATLGNVVGGVIMVSMLNYGQVKEEA
jgi:formate/nitrite transporter FocA (FNT family)